MYDDDDMSYKFLTKRPLIITTAIIHHMSITYA
jgi:hypothetical protein